MNLNDFLYEYPNIYANCIDQETKKLNCNQLIKAIKYLEAKYYHFDRERFFLYLTLCANREDTSNTSKLKFYDPKSLDFFERTKMGEFKKMIDKHRHIDGLCKELDIYSENINLLEDLQLLVEENIEINKRHLEEDIVERNTLLGQFSNEQLLFLNNKLADEYIIGLDLKITQELFSSKNIQISSILQWMKSNRLLSYLFETLIAKELIFNEDYPSILGRNRIFKNKKGKLLNENDINQAKYQYLEESSNLKGREELDEIIYQLLELRK